MNYNRNRSRRPRPIRTTDTTPPVNPVLEGSRYRDLLEQRLDRIERQAAALFSEQDELKRHPPSTSSRRLVEIRSELARLRAKADSVLDELERFESIEIKSRSPVMQHRSNNSGDTRQQRGNNQAAVLAQQSHRPNRL